MTDWPSLDARPGATRRADVSVGRPAGNGTTSLIDLSGKDCAWPATGASHAATAIAKIGRARIIRLTRSLHDLDPGQPHHLGPFRRLLRDDGGEFPRRRDLRLDAELGK